MVHRFDLHVHSFFSADAASAPEELIDAARVRPDSVSYGSIGSGSPQHLAAELLSSMAKARFLHIP